MTAPTQSLSQISQQPTNNLNSNDVWLTDVLNEQHLFFAQPLGPRSWVEKGKASLPPPSF